MQTMPQDVELTDEHKRQLATLANEAGKPWSEVLAEALRTYRPRGTTTDDSTELSLYEGLKRDGVLGMVKDAPHDLSTNPKHMEGFGRDHQTGTD